MRNQKVRTSNDDDQSSSHRPSAVCLRKKSTIRLHGRNLLEFMGLVAAYGADGKKKKFIPRHAVISVVGNLSMNKKQ